MSALLTEQELEDIKRIGVSAGLKAITEGELSTGDVIAALNVGIKAAFRAARLVEIRIVHDGDATGELVLDDPVWICFECDHKQTERGQCEKCGGSTQQLGDEKHAEQAEQG